MQNRVGASKLLYSPVNEHNTYLCWNSIVIHEFYLHALTYWTERVLRLAHSVTMVTVVDHHPKFQFHFKKGSSKKNSYERRAYESVDDKSLS